MRGDTSNSFSPPYTSTRSLMSALYTDFRAVNDNIKSFRNTNPGIAYLNSSYHPKTTERLVTTKDIISGFFGLLIAALLAFGGYIASGIKDDIGTLKNDIKSQVTLVGEFKTDTAKNIGEIKTSLAKEIGDLRSDVRVIGQKLDDLVAVQKKNR